MKCPICNGKTKVLNSRVNGKGIRRYRECLECLTRFHTNETIDIHSLDPYLRGYVLRKTGDM
ncbi:MAG TPA: hypothetical protein GX497_05585 [Bacillus bacterium]|nr:hypothetical protein [Bacillus sp. (in: firmicutes)]